MVKRAKERAILTEELSTKKGAILHQRITSKQDRVWREKAKAAGLPFSEWVRRRLDEAA